jgi:hypothetical protein
MATLNGTILDINGKPPGPFNQDGRGCPRPGPVPVNTNGSIDPIWATSHIYFRPIQTPFIDSAQANALILSSQRTRARIDCKTGAFTVDLAVGNYIATVGRDSFAINIPADVGVFNLFDAGIITSPMNFAPPASNANQGTFVSQAADFVLPANPVGDPGAPVATGWTKIVYGPGKFQICATLSILATSRDGNQQDNEQYTALLYDVTDAVQVGASATVENIFTGATGQLTIAGTITIAGATNVTIAIYAAGNPNTTDPTAAPNSVGTVKMAASSISIARLP